MVFMYVTFWPPNFLNYSIIIHTTGFIQFSFISNKIFFSKTYPLSLSSFIIRLKLKSLRGFCIDKYPDNNVENYARHFSRMKKKLSTFPIIHVNLRKKSVFEPVFFFRMILCQLIFKSLRILDTLDFYFLWQYIAILTHYETVYIAEFCCLSVYRNGWSFVLLTCRSRGQILQGLLFLWILVGVTC